MDDLPVHPNTLSSLDSLGLDTVRELHSILVEKRVEQWKEWTADQDILDVPILPLASGQKLSFLAVCSLLMVPIPRFFQV